MRAPSTSSLSVELLSPVIDVKYGCFNFTFFNSFYQILRYISLDLNVRKVNFSPNKNVIQQGFLLT